MRLRVLGPIELDDGDRAVSLAPQVRRIVALLVAADGDTVTGDRIAEHLGESDAGGSAVRTAVSRVRKVLGERVETSAGGYRLRLLEGDELDADRFLTLSDRALSLDGAERRAVLAEALGLWRGAALGELADEPWATGLATRLEGRRASAVEDLAETLIALRRAPDAVELLERHVAEQPYRERPVELLMRALAASGRVTDAVRAFQRFRISLREEIGIEPSASLRQVESDILGGLDETRPAPATSAALPAGTVTFLFTDIEGSTTLWQDDEAGMAAALARHDEVIRSAVEAHGGVVFKHTGDGICAVFVSAAAAARAARAAQETLALPVRMGLHTGEAEVRDGDYFGSTVSRAARIMDAGHGGQILASSATAVLLPDDDLLDLGHHDLRGLTAPERLHQLGAGGFPPLRAARHRAGNLPTGLTSFVGRDLELASVADQLAEHRLVTLIGVGGTGKTRLAIEAAHAVGALFPDGCWLAELTPVVAPEAVPFAVTTGLGLTAPVGADVTDELVRRLVDRRLLVIVDNCEHVLDAAASVVERIVASCPDVTVLATSREPLMIAGERLVPVPSLGSADGIELFRDRARAEVPDIVLDGAQAAAVEELCRRLDGLPLAIELAASRVRSFTPVELVEQLEERFRLLVGGRRSRMERHQTMRGTLDWSYELCTPVQRAVFDRLSVFPATFDLAGARSVAVGDGVTDLDVVDTVPQLVDRSLLQRSTTSGGTTRFRMLETMRSYGRAHLAEQGEADDVRKRHAQYVAASLSKPVDFGPDEDSAVDRVLELRADALVALDWFIDQRRWCEGVRLVTPMILTSTREGYEMARRLRVSCDRSGDHPPCEDEIAVGDVVGRMVESADVTNARIWRLLRSPEPVPVDYAPFPPHMAFASIAPDEVDEAVAALDRYATARPEVRILEHYAAALALAHHGHVDAAAGVLATFESQIEGLESRAAPRLRCSLQAEIAQRRLDLDTAVEQLLAARREESSKRPPNWFDVFVELSLLHVRAVRGDVPEAADVRRGWQWLRDEGVLILAPRAAIATAAVAERVGEPGVARRLLAWALASLGGSSELALELRDVDLTDVPAESRDTLDSIMTVAMDLADRLDT